MTNPALRLVHQSTASYLPHIGNNLGFRIDRSGRYVQSHQPPSSWQIKVVEKVVALSRLQPGWDGYRAVPIKTDVLLFAMQILTDVLGPGSAAPQLVPLSNGDVQLEWHTKGIDLELTVHGPLDSELWFEDHTSSGATPRSEAIGENLAPLMECLRILDRR